MEHFENQKPKAEIEQHQDKTEKVLKPNTHNSNNLATSSARSSYSSTPGEFGHYRDIDVESLNSKKSASSAGSNLGLDNEEYRQNENHEEEEEENDEEEVPDENWGQDFHQIVNNESESESDDDHAPSNLLSQPESSSIETASYTLVQDAEPFDSSPYSRLTRTVRSYLNAANSIQISNSESTNESILSRFGTNINLTFTSSTSTNPVKNENLKHLESNRVLNGIPKFEPKSSLFDKILNEANKKKFSKHSKSNINLKVLFKLANLFLKHENYHTTMLMPISDNFKIDNNVEITTKKSNKRMKHSSSENINDLETKDCDVFSIRNSDESLSLSESQQDEVVSKLPANEFHLCALCSHCLCEPITLICGCSYCKNCLIEYNSTMDVLKGKKDSRIKNTELNETEVVSGHERAFCSNKRKFNTNNIQSDLVLYKCYNCAFVHDHNTTEHLKVNVLLSKLVDKFWIKNVEIRKLRNDIRRYVCFLMETDVEKFNFKKFEFMFQKASELDPSNNLILADLFILNYFNGCNEECLKYAQLAAELRPNWSFGDLNQLKNNLITCLKLEPHIEQIRLQLHQILMTFDKEEASKSIFNQLITNETLSNDSKQTPQTNSSLSLNRDYSRDLNNNDFTQTNNNPNNLNDAQQTQSVLNFDSSKYVVVNSHLVKSVELECSLCYRLLYKPVTTPCGHSFCCSCLDRSLDHQDKCPLCKNTLADYLAERRQYVTRFIDSLITNFYKTELEERQKQFMDELRELISDDNEIPVFICTLGMPFVPCPLHIYEPRYRLMLRRAIEAGSRQFGMCMYSEKTPYRYTEYGCMLEIQTYQFTRDGRAIVTTVGGRRFRVIKSNTKDGYNIAKVEWVVDLKCETEPERTELQHLHDEVYRLAQTWYSFIPETQKNRISSIYGITELPEAELDIQTENGPVWHWFLLNILPLESDFKYKFLTKTSLKDRLIQMRKIMLVLMTPLRRMFCNQSQSTTPIESANSADVSTAASVHSDAGTASTENSDRNASSGQTSRPNLEAHNNQNEADSTQGPGPI